MNDVLHSGGGHTARMRVAALYDIHGNLPALEAVLEEVFAADVDRIVVGGDVVPGPMPRESVSTLLDLSLPVDFIYGNGERDVLAMRAGSVVPRVPERVHDVMRWTGAELTDAQCVDIGTWPLAVTLEISGLGRVMFCHATPHDEFEIFTRLTPESRLRPLFDALEVEIVVCGHTHMQFDRTVGGIRVVNAGSVGMPFGDAGAYWALLSSEVELRRTSYNLELAAERIGKTEYPQVAEFDVKRPRSEAEMLELLEAAARG